MVSKYAMRLDSAVDDTSVFTTEVVPTFSGPSEAFRSSLRYFWPCQLLEPRYVIRKVCNIVLWKFTV